MSGVEVPPLGSSRDKVFRAFLTKKAQKEVAKTKALTLGALAMTMLVKADAIGKDLVSSFNDYTNMELFMEGAKQQVETDLREEYEYWRKIRPELNIVKGEGGEPKLVLKNFVLPKEY